MLLHSFTWCYIVLQGVPWSYIVLLNSEIGGGGVCKKNFVALRASVCSKNNGGPCPPLDPPLSYRCFLCFFENF